MFNHYGNKTLLLVALHLLQNIFALAEQIL